ncbi:Chromodomain-helicase-DNA-binding protein, putative [Hondaea fermentalgiana]|uniref:Chromodomain-helicase-DNA-binding protein, putative n=1 Tax=Hondaea fermentalgiana TaxID=2315210 RepID=A0A2R5GWU5_9STRA|nr:Chromodomain-helicase-DNA-binding protein, putative [Hondaea fermentalgiana]|eukprot:GBG32881.1 Chromodomain-helicase-DNA-binding protein, putative [Hondaea fermentalgiana]
MPGPGRPRRTASSGGASSSSSAAKPTTPATSTARRTPRRGAAVAAAAPASPASGSEDKDKSPTRRRSTRDRATKNYKEPSLDVDGESGDEDADTSGSEGGKNASIKKKTAAKQDAKSQQRRPKKRAASTGTAMNEPSSRPKRRRGSTGDVGISKKAGDAKQTKTASAVSGAAARKTRAKPGPKPGAGRGGRPRGAKARASEKMEVDDDDDDDDVDEEEDFDDEDEDEDVVNDIIDGAEDEEDDDDDEEEDDDDDDLDDLGDDDLDEMEDGNVEGHGEDGVVELKVEKLLAHHRKTKGEWIAFCKGQTTSRVLNGRRREMLAFELSSGDNASKADDDDNDGRSSLGGIAKRMRRLPKLSKKKLRKQETRYLVKWLNNAFIHVSWETAKGLRAFFGDNAMVDRHLRKLENSFAMMDAEELSDLQQVDRLVDYNTFVEDDEDEGENGSEGKSATQDKQGDADEGTTEKGQNKKTDSKKGSGENGAPSSAKKQKGSESAKKQKEAVSWEYLVKWKSQGYEDATWELWSDIKDHPDIDAKLKLHDLRNSVAYRRNRNKVGSQELDYSSARTFKNGRKLRSYQVEAVTWLAVNFSSERNSILADEMGLGKTCQTVTFTHRLRHQFNRNGPFLVVAPLATLPHWQREFEAWTDFNCLTYHGSAEGRELIRSKEFFWDDGRSIMKGPGGLPKFDALVTNYETVLSDASMLRRFKWDLLIVDEAHRLKNRDSKLTVCLRESFKYRASLLLTGTPIQNSLPELWTLLNFIAPEDFASLDAFKEKFGNMQTAEEMDRFHARLRPYMLRRIKSEVEPLPEREDTMIEVELTTMQKRFYRAIYEKNTEYLLAGVVKGARVSLNNVAMELRKCCCHPYLIDGVESKVLKDDPPPRTATSEERSSHVFDKLINASGKLILLDKLLPKLKAEGHRVLIFSQMTRMLDILEDYLLHRSYAYERIDGSVRGVDRQFAIDRFSSKNSQAFAFLLSTRGCGQGINLTAADTVIMYDGDWNPQNDVQALARCHRIGQTKRVKVYRLITRKTYEYTMFERASMKLGLDHAVMSGITKEDGTDKSGKSPRAKAKSKREQDLETERLLKFGAYALTADGDDDAATQQFMNANIDEILSSRAKLMATSKEDNQLSKATFVASDNDTNLDINDPEFWTKVVGLQAKNEDDEDDEDDGDRRSRRRGKNKVNYAGNGFAAMGFDDDDDDDDVDDDDDEEEDVEEPRKDEDENGRKLWQRKHFQILLSAIQKFGYGRWDRLFADVNGRFPDRFTRSDVENAARGFLIFCIFKREESKKKKNNDDPSVASPAGDDSDDSDDDDDDDESETQEVSDTGRLSDFQLVNMTHAQLVEGIRSRTSHIEFNDTHRRLIDELTQGADWIVPDVLVTRRRILPSSMNELPKATVVKKEEEEKKMKKEGEEEEEKKAGEGSNAIKAEGVELAQKDGGTVKSEDVANASQNADAKGAAAIDTKKEGEGKEGKEEEEKEGGDEDEEPFKLEDSDSDDSDLEGEAREEHRQMRRGYAYNERVATRTMDAAAKYLRIFEKHASMQSILDKYTDGDRLLVEEFPQIPGIPPVAWWAPQDDLTLIKGLYDHGWDPRRSNATFSAIRKDGSLRFSKNPPMKDDDDADDDDEGGPEKNKKANAKTESKEDPSAPAKNGNGKVEEDKATEANAEGDAKAKSEPKTVALEDGDAKMKDAADEAAGAPAGKSDADGDAAMGEASDKATGDDEASRTPPRPVDTDLVWPRNHKLGLRAKRVVDWFSAQTRKTRRAEETQKRREARKEAKRLAKAKPKSKGPTVSPNWMRTELKALFKTLIRWGVPSEKPLDPKWRMSYAQLMQHAGLKRKTQAMVESQVKLLVQDAVQLRLRPDMNIERSKAIMGSTGSARKMMERIKVLRDLRGIVLTASDETLLRIISRFEKQLRSKKRTRMPEWWKSEHDLAMLKGASRHGIGNFLATDAIRSDPEFPFHKICNVTTGAAQSQAREKALLAKKEKKAAKADQGADKPNENGNDEDDDDEDEDNVNEEDDEDEDAKPVSSVGANSEKANGVEDNAKGGNDKTITDDGKADAGGEGDGSDSNEEGKHAFPSVVMFLNRLRTIVELVARSQRSSMLNHAFTSQPRTNRTPVQRKMSDFMNGNVQAKSETVDLTETKALDAATSALTSSSSSSSSSTPSPKLG